MKISSTHLDGVQLIEPKIFADARGYFLETSHAEKYRDAGIASAFVQDNLSHSRKGVLRGLHLQNPNAQGKLVMVVRGRVLDVAVDVRVGSPTFGQAVSVVLDDETHRQLWVPRGFAHGFLTLSDDATLLYKCDALYDPKTEISMRWNDPALGIDWRIDAPLLSDKDAQAPLLHDIADRLPRYEG